MNKETRLEDENENENENRGGKASKNILYTVGAVKSASTTHLGGEERV